MVLPTPLVAVAARAGLVLLVLTRVLAAQGPFGPAGSAVGFAASPGPALVDDFDADGLPDVLLARTSQGVSELRIYPGDGAGGLLPPLVTSWSNGAFGPAGEPVVLAGAGDLDGDGLLDAVAVPEPCCQPLPPVQWGLRVHRGTGGPLLAGPPSPLPYTSSRAVAVRDLDGDGRAEVVIGARVYALQPGSGLVTVTGHGLTHTEAAVALGDFDGDGRTDVAVAGAAGTALATTVLRQVAPLVFVPLPGPTVPGTSWDARRTWLLAGDVDGDGCDDLVAVEQTGPPAATAWTVPGGPGGLAASAAGPQIVAAADPSVDVPQLADVEEDGLPELVSGHALHRPSAAFPAYGAPPLPTLGGSAVAVALADLDGDGDRDLVLRDEQVIATPAGPVVVVDVAIAGNRALDRPGCPPPGAPLRFLIGTPAPGNAAFHLTLADLPPGTSAALGVSLAPSPLAPACSFAIDVEAPALVLAAAATAGADGAAAVHLPLPGPASLGGTALHAQWLAAHPQGPVQHQGTAFVLSASRRIVFW